MQVRYWDLRQPNPAHTQQLPERVYGMDVTHPLLVRRPASIHPLLPDKTVHGAVTWAWSHQMACMSCPISSGGASHGLCVMSHLCWRCSTDQKVQNESRLTFLTPQVVGTADRQISVFNLSAPQTPYKQIQSPLKFQTRCVTCFPDTTGYLVGSIEVRVRTLKPERRLCIPPAAVTVSMCASTAC